MAPSYDDDAYEVLAKKKNLRILIVPLAEATEVPHIESVSLVGGLLRQTSDDAVETADDLTVVTDVKPTEAQIESLLFAQQVVKHVKSNAIVIAKDGQTLGIGAGQMNRIAQWKSP